MHKYLITALFALVFAVPGMAKETPMPSSSEAIFAMQACGENPEMDPQLVEAILKAAAEECQYSYSELNGMYSNSEIQIGKFSGGYRVTLADGAVIDLLDDSF